MSLTIAIVLVWLHFFADFILQSDKIAIAKSSDWMALTMHVCLYMAPFFLLLFWITPAAMGAFLFVNWIGHFLTDAVSSRVCTKLFKAGERHWFFVVIGADQAIHLTTLFATFVWLA